MRNGGVWNPKRNAAICGLIAVAGIISVGLGFREMNALGHETGRTAAMIAFGLLAAIFGTAFFVNFLWAVRIVRDMRSGRTAIARWTLSPEEFARFCDVDRRFVERGHGNDYRPPKSALAQDLEVVFSEDGVLIGDCYFGLATTGISRFRSVGYISSDPPMIEFSTVLTAVTHITHVRVHKVVGKLRVPVATEAALRGQQVVQRYKDVVDRRVIVKPHFWTGRIKAGLVIAALSSLAAVAGFALREQNQDLHNIPLVLAVAGTIFAIGGLVLALLASNMRRRQHRG